MKVTTRELENREVELVIEIDDDRVDRTMRAIARKYARELKIPGFRPGRAPYAVVAQRVGRERLLQDALEQIAPQIYQEAIQEAGIEPYDLGPLDIASYQPLTLTATIPLAPRVELGDYHRLRVDVPEVEVSEEAVDAVMREYQAENAQLIPVNRAAAPGDQVILDLRIEIDGRIMYDQKNVSFVLSPGEFLGVPDELFERIAGMEPGEKQQFVLTYPEDFAGEDLAGKVGTFTVFLHEVKERELPDLDDELARTIGGFDSLEDLRAQTREALKTRAQLQADNEVAEAVIAQLLDMATIEYPPAALEREIDALIADLEARLKDQGLTLDNYLTIEGLTLEQLREQQRADAETRLKRRLVLSKVVELEGIEVSDAEVDREIEAIAAMYGRDAAQARGALSSEESRQTLRSRLLAQKAIDRLIEIATREKDEEVTDLPPVDTEMVGAAPAVDKPLIEQADETQQT